jgi:DnaJ-domain-containing protein 1
MVSRLHPDRHLAAPPSQQDAARRRFEQVMNAYNTLMDMEAVA